MPLGQSRNKYRCLTFREKMSLIEDREKHKLTYAKIAQKYRIGVSTVTGILLNRDKIVNISTTDADAGKRHRSRAPKYQQMETMLLADYRRAMESTSGGSVTNSWIENQAMAIAAQLGETEFRASKRWLLKFKSRNGLLGESRSRRLEAENDPNGTTSHNYETFQSNWMDQGQYQHQQPHQPGPESLDLETTTSSGIDNSPAPSAGDVEVILEQQESSSVKDDQPPTINPTELTVTNEQAIQAATQLIRHITQNTRVFTASSSSLLASLTSYLSDLLRKSSTASSSSLPATAKTSNQ